jgi:hypothetical protein
VRREECGWEDLGEDSEDMGRYGGVVLTSVVKKKRAKRWWREGNNELTGAKRVFEHSKTEKSMAKWIDDGVKLTGEQRTNEKRRRQNNTKPHYPHVGASPPMNRTRRRLTPCVTKETGSRPAPRAPSVTNP